VLWEIPYLPAKNPLIARQLIGRSNMHRHRTSESRIIFDILTIAIAAPLECARFTAGIALTLLAIPFIALYTLFNACQSIDEAQHVQEATYRI